MKTAKKALSLVLSFAMIASTVVSTSAFADESNAGEQGGAGAAQTQDATNSKEELESQIGIAKKDYQAGSGYDDSDNAYDHGSWNNFTTAYQNAHVTDEQTDAPQQKVNADAESLNGAMAMLQKSHSEIEALKSAIGNSQKAY